jgi:hypothetical protein
MTQLTVHAFDEQRGQPETAYSVCVTGGRAFVRAFRPEWAETAQRLEVTLNARLQPKPEVARADEQKVPSPR